MTSQETSVQVAVVQAGSIPFDADACVDKAVWLIADAAAAGAKVIVFPEAFIVGYPKGLGYGLVVGARDAAGREEFRIYLEAAIEVPGPHTQRLGEAAATAEQPLGHDHPDDDALRIAMTNVFVASASERVIDGARRLLVNEFEGEELKKHLLLESIIPRIPIRTIAVKTRIAEALVARGLGPVFLR